MISTFKEEYIDFLKKYDLLEQLIVHMGELASYEATSVDEALTSSMNDEMSLNMFISKLYMDSADLSQQELRLSKYNLNKSLIIKQGKSHGMLARCIQDSDKWEFKQFEIKQSIHLWERSKEKFEDLTNLKTLEV